MCMCVCGPSKLVTKVVVTQQGFGWTNNEEYN